MNGFIISKKILSSLELAEQLQVTSSRSRNVTVVSLLILY